MDCEFHKEIIFATVDCMYPNLGLMDILIFLGKTKIAGTDDDLPPSHQNRIPRGGRVAGNGRSAVGVPYSRMYGDTDMEAQIHQLEQEAYSSVLRAFKAQADLITWVLFVI